MDTCNPPGVQRELSGHSHSRRGMSTVALVPGAPGRSSQRGACRRWGSSVTGGFSGCSSRRLLPAALQLCRVVNFWSLASCLLSRQVTLSGRSHCFTGHAIHCRSQPFFASHSINEEPSRTRQLFGRLIRSRAMGSKRGIRISSSRTLRRGIGSIGSAVSPRSSGRATAASST